MLGWEDNRRIGREGKVRQSWLARKPVGSGGLFLGKKRPMTHWHSTYCVNRSHQGMAILKSKKRGVETPDRAPVLRLNGRKNRQTTVDEKWKGTEPRTSMKSVEKGT